MLDLPEAFVLLTTDPGTGRAVGVWRPGLVGAVLLALLEGGSVAREDDHLSTTPVRPLEGVALEAWRVVAERPRPRRTAWWVHQLSARNAPGWHAATSQRLVDRGVLRREVRGAGRVRYPDAGGRARDALVVRLRAQLGTDEPDRGLASVLSLVVAANASSQLGDGPDRIAWRRATRDWERTGVLGDDVAAVCDGVRDAVAALAVG